MKEDRLTFSGYLGADPDIRYTAAGKEVVAFRVDATDGSRKSGLRFSRTASRRCVAADTLAEIASTLKQGSRVLVEGTLRLRTWKDRYGKTHSVEEILVESLYVSGMSDAPEGLVVKPTSPLEAARAAGLFGYDTQA